MAQCLCGSIPSDHQILIQRLDRAKLDHMTSLTSVRKQCCVPLVLDDGNVNWNEGRKKKKEERIKETLEGEIKKNISGGLARRTERKIMVVAEQQMEKREGKEEGREKFKKRKEGRKKIRKTDGMDG